MATTRRRPAPTSEIVVLTEQQQALPFWSDRSRGLPNALARSALFTVGSKREPRFHHKSPVKIASLNNYQILVKGEELRQEDASVFMQLLHLAREHDMNVPIKFTAYSMLKELGWGFSGESYERLFRSIDRLQGTGLRILEIGAGGFQGPLVSKFFWREEDGRKTEWCVMLDREIVKLFAPTAYTQLHWEQRQKLRSELAKWLHSYYSTHEYPNPLKVETIKQLCHSRMARLTDFRKGLRTALAELEKIGFLLSWEIDKGDVVRIYRNLREGRSPPRRLAPTEDVEDVTEQFVDPATAQKK